MSNIDQSLPNLLLDEIKLKNNNSQINQIIDLLSNYDEIEILLTKNILTIPKDKLPKLLKVLSVLSQETNNVAPLNNIINVLNEIFKDSKLEIYEIPLLVKVVSENVSKENIANISSTDFSLLLKLLIVILIELKILKLNSTDVKIINTLIDTSLDLLNIQLPNKENVKKYCSLLC
jgi:hypothetical protein